MSAARKIAVTPRRRGLYGKIAIARKTLGLMDDDTWRDKLAGRYGGKRSLTQLRDADLVDLVEHLRDLGFKPSKSGPRRAEDPMSRKIRALWLSLYHLGVATDPAETAIVAFATRVTGGKGKGKQALQFLTGEERSQVIEGLKDWATRDGGVDWSPYYHNGKKIKDEPRQRVIEAQWRRALDLGAITPKPFTRPVDYARGITGLGGFQFYKPADFDRVIEALGQIIRKAQAD